VFIQDQTAGNNTVIPCTSFKARPYTNTQNAGYVVNYGKQFTADEQGAVQVTLGAITKPPIMLQPQTNQPEQPGQLLRWIMSHQYLDGQKSIMSGTMTGVHRRTSRSISCVTAVIQAAL
jgi:hypothetical protein